MSCATFEEWIALDASGDLSPTERATLANHLPTCASCRQLASDMGATYQSIQQLAGQTPNPLEGELLRRRVQRQLMTNQELSVDEPIPGPNANATVTVVSTPSKIRRKTWGWAAAAILILALGWMTNLFDGMRRSLPAGNVQTIAQDDTSPVTPAPHSMQTPLRAPSVPEGLPQEVGETAAVEDTVASVMEPIIPQVLDTASLETTAPETTAQAETVRTEELTPTHTVAADLALLSTTPHASPKRENTPTHLATTPEPMVIQLVSDDNDVVIYWLVAANS